MKPEENPWAVNTFEDFQFYCCPECDLKEHTKDKFVKHALENHTEYKDYIVNLMIKPELYEEGEYIDKVDSHYDFTEKCTKSEIKQEFDAAQDDELLENCDNFEDESQFSSDHNMVKPKKRIRRKHSKNELNGNNKMEEKKTKFKKSGENVHEYIKCCLCEKSFAKLASLRQHLTTMHDQHKCERCFKTNKCEYCGKIYERKYDFDRHVDLVHKGLKYFYCEECGKGFTTKFYVGAHKKVVHQGRKDFQCDLCEKSFQHKSAKQIHIRAVHEKRMDYSCETCKYFACLQ